jgi:hypothetical protein
MRPAASASLPGISGRSDRNVEARGLLNRNGVQRATAETGVLCLTNCAYGPHSHDSVLAAVASRPWPTNRPALSDAEDTSEPPPHGVRLRAGRACGSPFGPRRASGRASSQA